MEKIAFKDVTLRDPKPEDLEPLAYYFYDCPDSKHVHAHINYDNFPSREGFLEDYKTKITSGEKTTFVVIELFRKAIGIHSLTHFEGKTAHIHAHIWDVPMRGKGIANFSGVKALDLFFERFELEKIYICPPIDNKFSSRFMEKIGLKKVETKEYESKILIPGIVVDVYEATPSLLREFKEKQGYID